jgi:hypothetical protein
MPQYKIQVTLKDSGRQPGTFTHSDYSAEEVAEVRAKLEQYLSMPPFVSIGNKWYPVSNIAFIAVIEQT